MKPNVQTRSLLLLIATSFLASLVEAVPVSEGEAKLAAAAWVAASDACGTKASGQARAATRHEVGGGAYYAVKLDSGMVFTSADTECEPIVAVTSADHFDENEQNPLVHLLRRDAEVRAALASARTKAPPPGGFLRKTLGTGKAMPSESPSDRWATLIGNGEKLLQTTGGAAVKGVSPRTSVSDVRVAPLLKTTWSQLTHNDSINGSPCYNYYTPEVLYYYYTSSSTIYVPGTKIRAYCGCSATALAQVLKFWEYPVSSRPSRSYSCKVTDIKKSSSGGWQQYVTTKTLSTIGGTYAWSSMKEHPSSGITDANGEAIGHLTYDCAVALRSDFSATGTGALPSNQKSALKDVFGYKSAQYFYSSRNSDLSTNEAMHRRAIYASLDAGAPVLLAIYEYDGWDVNGGHCVVGDGYGYATVSGATVPFVHLNMGWSGTDDVWYNLPNVDTEGAGYDNGNYNVFWGVIYNIFPDRTGEVVSGRVLDANGNPVSGATVVAKQAGFTKGTSTTDAKGIYAFVLPGGNSYSISASVPGGAIGSVTTPTVPTSGSSIGNSWGNDISLAQNADLAVELAFLSLQSGDYDAVDSCSQFEVGQPVVAHSLIVNVGDGVAKAPIVERHELLDHAGRVLDFYEYADDGDLSSGGSSSWSRGLSLSFLQNLSVGSYTYRVTVDPYETVVDSDRDNNVADFAFSVVESQGRLADISIIGVTALRPGETASYRCLARYDNGATKYVNPVWEIGANPQYASVDTNGQVTAGVDSRPHTVQLKAAYGENGISATDFLTISIQAAISLNEAVDNAALVFTTGGDAPWYGQTVTRSPADDDAAASGVIGDYGTSELRTTVTGPGTLAFDWLVSSEANYDWFDFLCDGQRLLHKSGTDAENWSQFSVALEAGTHTLVWRYSKDVSNGWGLDAAFVDRVQWTQLVTPTEVQIQLSDLDVIVAGESRQLHADVTMSDGSVKSVGAEASWGVLDDGCATITEGGFLTTRESVSDSEVTVMVAYSENGVTQGDTETIRIRGKLPLPAKPVLVSAVGDPSGVFLSWTASRHAQSYRVYRASVNSSDYVCLASSLVGQGYSDSTAVPGVDYVYVVEAVNASGCTRSDPSTAYRQVTVSVDPTEVSFDHQGGTLESAVKANAPWLSETSADWVALSMPSGLTNGVLQATVGTNTVESPRTAIITVTAGADTDHPATASVRLTQAAAPIEEPEKCDFAFAKIDGGDATACLYATTNDLGKAVRVLDAGRQFCVRFGWRNVGLGDCRDDVVNVVELDDLTDRTVSSHTLIETGPIAAGAAKTALLKGSDWSELAPGPYVLRATLNAPNRSAEENPSDNERVWRFALRDQLDLATALGCEALVFETTDDEWFGSKRLGEAGGAAAMTRHSGDGGTNTLKATVTGAGTLSFAYRVSSEARDLLTFTADGATVFAESGKGAWRTKSVHLEGDGEHVLVWQYGKDETLSEHGDCAFLANMVWTGDNAFESPTGVTAEDGDSSSSIKVSWNAVPGAESYEVARAENPSGPWTVLRRNVRLCFMSDASDVRGGVEYFYRVRAVFATGVSDWSESDAGYLLPSLILIGSDRTVPGDGGQTAIDVFANCRWQTSVTGGAAWLKAETEFGEGRSKIVLGYSANATGSERKGKIVLSSVGAAGSPVSVTISVTQGVPVDLGSEVSLNAAADSDLVFVRAGDADWRGQTRVSHDGRSALRSGAIVKGGTTSLSTVFVKSGKLAFWWGTSSWTNQDVLALYVAGEKVAEISGTSGGTSMSAYDKKIVLWEHREIDIPAGGAIVEWRFTKNWSGAWGEDAGFVDEIVWTPDTPVAKEDDAWWKEHGAALMIRLGITDREAIMKMQSPGSEGSGGKFKSDGSPMYVWEDYVAGTNPLDGDSTFLATIDMSEGTPKIRWCPELTESEEALRHYQVLGRRSLTDGDWEPVPESDEGNYEFFRVTVELK